MMLPGERALAASVRIQEQISAGRKAEKRFLRLRRNSWLKAVSEAGSVVTRERIARECGVSIQSVDTELATARKEATSE